MAIPWLIAGGIALFAVAALWDEIVDWLKDMWQIVKRTFSRVIHATAAFVQKVKSAISKIMHRVYYKEDNHWIEETTTRQIPENELPDRIRRKLRTSETEVTEDLEAMGLEV